MIDWAYHGTGLVLTDRVADESTGEEPGRDCPPSHGSMWPLQSDESTAALEHPRNSQDVWIGVSRDLLITTL